VICENHLRLRVDTNLIQIGTPLNRTLCKLQLAREPSVTD